MTEPTNDFHKVVFVTTLNIDSTVTVSCVKEGGMTVEEALALGQNFARYIAEGMNIPIDLFIRSLREIESEIKKDVPLITRVM